MSRTGCASTSINSFKSVTSWRFGSTSISLWIAELKRSMCVKAVLVLVGAAALHLCTAALLPHILPETPFPPWVAVLWIQQPGSTGLVTVVLFSALLGGTATLLALHFTSRWPSWCESPADGASWELSEEVIVVEECILRSATITCLLATPITPPPSTPITPPPSPAALLQVTPRVAEASAQGVRKEMQDACVILDSLGELLRARGGSVQAGGELLLEQAASAFVGVFDGHSSSTVSQFASQHILSLLLGSTHFPDDIPAALRSAVLTLESMLLEASRSEETAFVGGTTALVVLLWGSVVYIANVGDSRAVLSSASRAKDLTADHKPNTCSELLRIQEKGGFVDVEGYLNGELGVARALGNHDTALKGSTGLDGPLTADPDIFTHALAAQDELLIVACDGLWDVMKSQEAVDIACACLRQSNDPKVAAEQLVQTALARQSSDNVTAAILCFSDSPPPARPRPSFPNSRLRCSTSRLSLA